MKFTHLKKLASRVFERQLASFLVFIK